MSWDTFKSNIVAKLSNPKTIQSSDDFAILLAKEYDKVIKGGGDFFNRAPLKQGNYDLMESQFKLAFLRGALTVGKFNLIKELGKGVVSYWRGAKLHNFPIPLIPAKGSIQNLRVTNNIVTSAGIWPPSFPPPYVTETEVWVDLFIKYARMHLRTVRGIAFTDSLYPPNGNVAPGSVNWFVYDVKPPVLLQSSPISFEESKENPDKENLSVIFFPKGSSLGSSIAIRVLGLNDYDSEKTFFLSDGDESREFKWLSYPNTAIGIGESV